MPYGVDKKIGGDSPENVSFMEKCVSDIKGTNKRTGQPYTKGEKVAICKNALKQHKAKSSLEVEYKDMSSIDPNIFTDVDNIIGDAVEKLVKSKRVNSTIDAIALVEAMLAKANYETDILKLIFNK